MESTAVVSIGTLEEARGGKGVKRRKRARSVRARASPTQRRTLSRRHLAGLTTSFWSSRGGKGKQGK